jgi:hypothetical protein
LRTSADWACQGCHDLKLSNRPVRTRMPGGVAGAQPIMAAPYADLTSVRNGVFLQPQRRSNRAARLFAQIRLPAGLGLIAKAPHWRFRSFQDATAPHDCRCSAS